MDSRNIRRAGGAALLAGAVLLANHGRDAVAHDYGFTLGTPVQVWAGDANEPTRYMIPGDFDGDGRLDVIHVTTSRAQVLRNTGLAGATPSFSLMQELPVDFSSCGNAIDWDSDGDLDLVLGDANRVLLATNAGGAFTLSTLLTHNLGVPVSAVGFTGPTAVVTFPISFERYVAWAPDQANGTGQILRQTGMSMTPIFTMPPAHADWIEVRSNGAVRRVLVANRQSTSTSPVNAFDVTNIIAPAVADVTASLANPSAYGFGYNVDAGGGGRTGWGSWGSGTVLGSPGEDPIVPIGPAFPNGEVTGFEFADMDADMDTDEVVMVGRDTGVVVANFSSNADDPLHRFVSADIPGLSLHLVVGNFDTDLFADTDVLVGGTQGIWFLGNDTGPAGPPPHDAHLKLLCAIDGLLELLDEYRVPDVDEGFARNDLVDALEDLLDTDPDFLRAGILDGGLPLTQAIGISTDIDDAVDEINFAMAEFEITSKPANLAALLVILDCLNDAKLDILEQIAELTAPPPVIPAKPTGGVRRTTRLVERFRDSFEVARQLDQQAGMAIGTDAVIAARGESLDAAVRATSRGIKALRAVQKLNR